MQIGAETAYAAARILTCGIWISAGLFKLTHWKATVQEMKHHHIPAADACLAVVIVLELLGSAMLIANTHVWAVALAWIAFTVPASVIYHGRIFLPAGIDFLQLVQFHKNVSIIGGLIALILLDPARPAWLFPG